LIDESKNLISEVDEYKKVEVDFDLKNDDIDIK
jgi:hypothetical protein